jgi:hypothetical protein
MTADEPTPDPAPRGGGEPPQEQEYGLVMPFVPVVSKGGPYDDDAYTAGWEMGQLSMLLEQVQPTSHTQTVHTTNLEQVDRLAQYHGYDLTTRSVWGMSEWSYVDLVRIGPGHGVMSARAHLRTVPATAPPDGGQ